MQGQLTAGRDAAYSRGRVFMLISSPYWKEKPDLKGSVP
jgi:hypothetical protein